MEPRTIENYGGPYQDARAVKDPTTQAAAAFYNRKSEDVAQMTSATGFTWFSFTTSSASPAVLAANTVSVSGLFGSGSAAKPTCEKTATGIYVLTWPTEFDDALVGVTGMESVAETQTVTFTFASGLNVFGATNGYARVVTLASNVVTVNVYNTSDALSDLSGSKIVSGYLR